MNSELSTSHCLSVSELNFMVKDLLESAIGSVWLEGEISNFSQPVSGHWYFTLKDARAQVRCAMFRNSNLRCQTKPKNGQSVRVKATLTLYEVRGEYQLIIDQLSPVGEGELQQRFELLKQKLTAEGLFAQHHKKPLPHSVTRVGLITSSTGAALHDMITVLKRRDKSISIIIYPTAVQGADAAKHIAHMIHVANQRNECDVLIVARGGGSLEDLWSFNEEIVARAIFASELPIISGVGHEVDVTICDFVADLRAPTPSAAAELVSQNQAEKRKQLIMQKQKLSMTLDYFLAQLSSRLQKLQSRLQQQHPALRLSRQKQQLLAFKTRLEKALQQQLRQKTLYFQRLKTALNKVPPTTRLYLSQQKLTENVVALKSAIQKRLQQNEKRFLLATTKLDSVSPLATLSRGYSITKKGNSVIIKRVNDVSINDTMLTVVQDGTIESCVIAINPKKS